MKKRLLVISLTRRPFQKVVVHMGGSCNAMTPADSAAAETPSAASAGSLGSPRATRKKWLQGHHWCNTKRHMRSPQAAII